MAVRYHQTASRVVVSRPGYNADDPSLADVNKIFDSNWDFSGVLIAAGVWPDPAPAASGDPWITSWISPVEILFPPPGYVPAAYVWSEYSETNEGFENVGFDGIQQSFPVGSGNYANTSTPNTLILEDRIRIQRAGSGSSRMRFPGGLRYMVFGVSQ